MRAYLIQALGYANTAYTFLRTHAPAVVALLVSVPFIMIFDRRVPRTIDTTTITPSPVKPGETATLIFTATDYRRCTGITIRWIVDSKGVRFLLSNSPVESSDELGVSHQFVKDFPIPLGITPGTATYHALVQRWRNPLQQFWTMNHDTTAKFDVVKK
jgi:hypothetical protein